ncbi:MAG: tetratricopeptide repeat protein [Candidatus Obscuribacterales bacterium]
MKLVRLISLAMIVALLIPPLAMLSASAAAPLDEASIKRRKIEVHRYLCNIYLAQKRKAEAAAEFKALLALKPRDADLELEYGTFLAHYGDYGAAIPHLKIAVDQDPGSAPANGALGTTLLRVKKFNEAIEYLRRAAGKEPEKYKKTYEDAYKYVAAEKQREAIKKRQAAAKKQYEAQQQKQKQQEDDDDW